MKLPRAHSRKLDALSDLTDVNRWASDVDLRINEIIQSLQQHAAKIQDVSTPSVRRGRITAHASQHLPAAYDALTTAIASTLDATTANAIGTASAFARSDHKHAITTAAPSGGYGTAAAVGSGGPLLRADATLVYPDGLADPTVRTKTLLFKDLAGVGAYLYSSLGTFAADKLTIDVAFGAAGGTFQIDNEGHIAAGNSGTSPDYVLTFQDDFNTATSVRGISAIVSQAGAGANANLGAGASSAIRGIAIQALMKGTNSLETVGCDSFYGATVAAATGDVLGYRAQARLVSGSGRTIANVTDYKSHPVTQFVSGTVTNYRCLWHTGNNPGTTHTNCFGSDIEAFNSGTNRWSYRGANKFECTLSDYLATTAGKGLVCKDSQGTPEFWRTFASVSGTTVKDATWTTDADGFASFTRAASATGSVIMNVQDVGNAAPLT